MNTLHKPTFTHPTHFDPKMDAVRTSETSATLPTSPIPLEIRNNTKLSFNVTVILK
jgi:hypothetical protein